MEKPPPPNLTPLSARQLEKQTTTEILERLAILLLAESPLRTQYQAHADKLRGNILAALPDPKTRQAFLDSRNILTELATLLTRCQDRTQLARALSYIKALNAGEVLIAQDDPRESEMRKRVDQFMRQRFSSWLTEEELTELINMVRFVGHDPLV